ncbi:MAG: fused MFS/spermidine synthase [Verrucomicrobiota bacterium]|nr:fused MFS/spermidine synthase [Verrucomicrobiota bacterium]
MNRNPVFQIIGLSCLLAAVSLAIWYIPRSTYVALASKGKVLHEETSEFSKIRIRGDEEKRHMLFVSDGGVEQVQSTIDLNNPGDLQVAYTKTMFASLLLKRPQRRVLLIGLGGGGMVRFVETHLPDMSIEVVEIDPVVVRLADKFFETRESPRVKIHTEDAFEFMAREHKPFDAIYMDAFLRPSIDGDPEGKTARLKTVAFLEIMRDQLVDDGVVSCNLISYRKTTPGDIEALREVFPAVELFKVPGTGNLVVIGSKQAGSRSEEEWAQEGKFVEKELPVLPFREFVENRKP